MSPAAQLVLVAGDEHQAIDIGRVGVGAADPDVLLARDRLIEDHVERAADLLLRSRRRQSPAAPPSAARGAASITSAGT